MTLFKRATKPVLGIYIDSSPVTSVVFCLCFFCFYKQFPARHSGFAQTENGLLKPIKIMRFGGDFFTPQPQKSSENLMVDS